MEGLILGFIGGMFVTYAFLYPETVKMVLGKVKTRLKKIVVRTKKTIDTDIDIV